MSNQPTWLTAEYLTRILQTFFKDPELKITRINTTSGSNDGDGFSSQVFRLKIDTNNKGVAIIGKIIKKSSSVQAVEEKLDYYMPEKFMYQVVLPKMLAKLPVPVKFFPEYYHADDDNRALFIEDLCQDGYRICDYSSGVDLQHSLLVMEALAKFHATSYLVFKEKPDLTKNLQKIFYSEDLASIIETAMISITRKGLLAAVMDQWDLAEEYKNKLRSGYDWTLKLIETWKKREDGFNVLVQTDCWVKNLMFKYEKNEVRSVKMIDFQMATYTSFALDLVNFIYSSTNVEVRLQDVNKLLDHYYDVFTGITGDLPNFNRKKLREEFNSKLFMGFIATLVYTPIIMAPPQKKPMNYDAILNNEDVPESNSIYENPKYLDCVKKLMPFFVENNVI